MHVTWVLAIETRALQDACVLTTRRQNPISLSLSEGRGAKPPQMYGRHNQNKNRFRTNLVSSRATSPP